MVGPVALEPFVLYEVDAVFLNPAFASGFVSEGDDFEIPAIGSPMGYGKMLRWKDRWESGVKQLGSGRGLFPNA